MKGMVHESRPYNFLLIQDSRDGSWSWPYIHIVFRLVYSWIVHSSCGNGHDLFASLDPSTVTCISIIQALNRSKSTIILRNQRKREREREYWTLLEFERYLSWTAVTRGVGGIGEWCVSSTFDASCGRKSTVFCLQYCSFHWVKI